MSQAHQDAHQLADDLRTIYAMAGEMMNAGGDAYVRAVYDQRNRLVGAMLRGQQTWQDIQNRGYTNTQLGRLLEFRLSSLPADMGAALLAVRNAVDAVSATIESDIRPIHGGEERTWDATARSDVWLTVTKAQRATLDTALGNLRSALLALAG